MATPKIMAYNKTASIVPEFLRNKFPPRTVIKSLIPNSSSRVSQSFGSSISVGNRANFSGFSPYSSLSQRWGLPTSTNRHQYSTFSSGAKRFYYQYSIQDWLQNPTKVLIVLLVSSGVILTVCFGSFETIPYSKRTHFVLLPRDLEIRMGASHFKEMRKSNKGRILPSEHPQSVRVRSILKEIAGALQRGLNVEQINREDEILDDKSVQGSEKDQEKGLQAKASQASQLDGLKWEVMVVDRPIVNAYCLPGGKIVVFTGLLKHFKSDDELATIIGHEVAHAVARHSAERITKYLFVLILQLIIKEYGISYETSETLSDYLLKLPFSRKMEMEADYIGLLLAAAAGFDPRVAPTVYKKLGKLSGGSSMLDDYLSTHPSGKKRAESLAKAKVMEEAIRTFNEAKAGREDEGLRLPK